MKLWANVRPGGIYVYIHLHMEHVICILATMSSG